MLLLYTTPSYDQLLLKIKLYSEKYNIPPEILKKYAVARRYNLWATEAVYKVFKEHPMVTKWPKRDRYVDWDIAGQQFDLKVTRVFASVSTEELNAFVNNPVPLMRRFLEGQSLARFHPRPHLFIAVDCLSATGERQPSESWKVKKELKRVRTAIDKYIALTYPKKELPVINFKYEGQEYATPADIIFVLKEGETFRGIFYKWENNEKDLYT
jgi:hypothetical protein